MAEIRAIPTRYAGCHFRSRLEARWAVFFDALGVQWEYEAQGYETAGGRYLPDFWLPEAEFWVEVKGALSHEDYVKIWSGVHDLRPPTTNQIVPQLLLVGPIPRPGVAWLHLRLDVLRDLVLWQQVYFDVDPHLAHPINETGVFTRDAIVGRTAEQTESARRFALAACPEPRLTVEPAVDAAYEAARSARFEFGQSG